MTYQQIILQRSDLKEEMEERAGIKQYSGNMSKAEAEDQTAKLMQKKYIIFNQPSPL